MSQGGGPGFYRGTTHEQTPFFTNKQKKEIESCDWPESFDIPVDTSKVKVELLRPWITNKIMELLGMEDDIVIDYCIQLLEVPLYEGDGAEAVCPKKMVISLQGFLPDGKALQYVKALWDLLVEAQSTDIGIPQNVLEARKKELIAQSREADRVREELELAKKNAARITSSGGTALKSLNGSASGANAEDDAASPRRRESDGGKPTKSGPDHRSSSRSGSIRRSSSPRNRSAVADRRRSRSPLPRNYRGRDDHYGRDRLPPSNYRRDDRPRRRYSSTSSEEDRRAARRRSSSRGRKERSSSRGRARRLDSVAENRYRRRRQYISRRERSESSASVGDRRTSVHARGRVGSESDASSRSPPRSPRRRPIRSNSPPMRSAARRRISPSRIKRRSPPTRRRSSRSVSPFRWCRSPPPRRRYNSSEERQQRSRRGGSPSPRSRRQASRSPQWEARRPREDESPAPAAESVRPAKDKESESSEGTPPRGAAPSGSRRCYMDEMEQPRRRLVVERMQGNEQKSSNDAGKPRRQSTSRDSSIVRRSPAPRRAPRRVDRSVTPPPRRRMSSDRSSSSGPRRPPVGGGRGRGAINSGREVDGESAGESSGHSRGDRRRSPAAPPPRQGVREPKSASPKRGQPKGDGKRSPESSPPPSTISTRKRDSHSVPSSGGSSDGDRGMESGPEKQARKRTRSLSDEGPPRKSRDLEVLKQRAREALLGTKKAITTGDDAKSD